MRLGEFDAHKHHVRRRRRRTLKRTSIFLLVFAVVLSIAGFGYTWYVGQQAPPPAPDISNLPKQKSEPKKLKPTKNSQVGIAPQTFSSPIKNGQNATMSIKTLPGAACSITFTIDDKNTRSKDTGLIPKIADDYGFVEWTWKVTAQPGTWPVEITCANGNNSSYYRGDMVVK